MNDYGFSRTNCEFLQSCEIVEKIKIVEIEAQAFKMDHYSTRYILLSIKIQLGLLKHCIHTRRLHTVDAGVGTDD